MHQIVFSTDDNYAAYCGVAILSLIENASRDQLYTIDVLYTSLVEQNILRLNNLSKPNVKVRCVDVSELMKNRKIRNTQHLTAASSYSLLIAELYPEHEKVAYLDSDIVVTDDIAKFFEFDLGNSVMGVILGYLCENLGKWCFYDYVVNKLGVPADKFFNAGILLINTKQFKAEQISEKCYKMLSGRRTFEYMDQDVLNITCQGKVTFLPQEWNYEWTYTFSPTVEPDPRRIAMRDFGSIPAIIHYSSSTKPWENPDYPLSQHFWEYARKSVFYEEILFNNSLSAFKRWIFPFGRVPRGSKVILYGGGKVGNAYFKQILQTNHCKIVKWCDQKYNKIRYSPRRLDPPEILYTEEFDWVIIAIEHERTAKMVRDILIKNGVDENKIIIETTNF